MADIRFLFSSWIWSWLDNPKSIGWCTDLFHPGRKWCGRKIGPRRENWILWVSQQEITLRSFVTQETTLSEPGVRNSLSSFHPPDQIVLIVKCKQARKLQDAQAEKLTSLQAERWQVDKMTRWQVDKMTSWQDDKLTSWQGDKLTGWQVDKMASWQDDKLTRWQDNKITRWQDDKFTWWQVDMMTSWQDPSSLIIDHDPMSFVSCIQA